MADQEIFHDTQGDSGARPVRVLFAGDSYEGQAVLAVSEDDIVLAAGRTTVVAVNEEFGVLISGKVSVSAMPDEVAFMGGYARMDPRHVAFLPSTTPTPIPLFVKAIPELLQPTDDIGNQLDYLESLSDIGL